MIFITTEIQKIGFDQLFVLSHANLLSAGQAWVKAYF